MKRIYTFGHEQVERNITVGDIISNKNNNVKMTQVTAANQEEAEIIANAGKKGSIIITTSISGRGVDIQLGGKKNSLKEEELKKSKDEISGEKIVCIHTI